MPMEDRRRRADGALYIRHIVHVLFQLVPWGSSIHFKMYTGKIFAYLYSSLTSNGDVRVPRTSSFLTPATTVTTRNNTMTATNSGRPEDDSRPPMSATCEGGVQCCGHDHQEDDDVSGEVESHCGGGCCADNLQEDEDVSGENEPHCGGECCADDEASELEPNLEPCEDSCCGEGEDHGVHEESACERDPRGMGHIR